MAIDDKPQARRENTGDSMTGRDKNNMDQNGGAGPGMSRRNVLSTSAMLLAGSAASLAVDSSSVRAATAKDFDAAALLDERITNLRIGEKIGLGVETDSGVIDVAATAK